MKPLSSITYYYEAARQNRNKETFIYRHKNERILHITEMKCYISNDDRRNHYKTHVFTTHELAEVIHM